MKKRAKDNILSIMLGILAFFAISPLMFIVFALIRIGIGYLSWELISTYPKNLGREGGILNALTGSFILIAISVTIALPLCLFSAVYLTEFVKNRRIKTTINAFIEILAGVPSIVFGIFGYYLFVYVFGFGFSLISASLTLSLMMIPIMMRTIEETLELVPKEIKMSAYALGASEWETAWNVSLRQAAPGIVTGVLLAIGRILGETAPLILTTGYNFRTPQSFLEGVATLTFTMYEYVELGAAYPELMGKAAATGLLLISIILLVDFVTLYLSKKLTKTILI